MATWGEYAKQCAEELALCQKAYDFNASMSRIKKHLANNPPSFNEKDFWKWVWEDYKKAPKPMLKESSAAEALMQLASEAEKYLKQLAGIS